MKLRATLLLVISLIALTVSAQQAKYIFYFIGDGMGPGHVMAAQQYNRLALGNDNPLTMMQFPVQSYSTTYSASSPVTDSAAAGTALAVGQKTRNNMLGMNADTIAVNSIATTLHNDGYGVAILTTVAADDATPGAFYAHVPSRSKYAEIDRFAADCDFELIAGAALRGFRDKQGNDTGAEAYLRSKGVDIVRGTDALAASEARRVVMFPEQPWADWNLGYTIDSHPATLSLDEMLEGAISHLGKHTPDRFFIMAEGGNIDHAAHANDAGTVIKEVIAFNKAIARALDFYHRHPDETLIVVTADHETGGFSLGNNHVKYNANLHYFIPQKISQERFSQYCDSLLTYKAPVTWPEMKQFLTDNLGFYDVVPISETDDALLQAAFQKTFVDGEANHLETLYADLNKFPVEVFAMQNRLAGIGWTTYSHTGNYVPLFAIGVGADRFTPSADNTRIPALILQSTRAER